LMAGTAPATTILNLGSLTGGVGNAGPNSSTTPESFVAAYQSVTETGGTDPSISAFNSQPNLTCPSGPCGGDLQAYLH
jgi:hypothetical protein